MKFSSQNEYGKISEVFLKSIADGFGSQSKLNLHWEHLNYSFCPDFEKAINEYDHFVKILQLNDINVRYFPKDNSVGLDSIYCRDASIVSDHGIILCNMGKLARASEPEAQAKFYQDIGMPVLGKIESPGLLEGGDSAWLDPETLVVGKGYRSNFEGVRQLEKLLNPYGIQVYSFDLPHYNGPQDVFHLMSIFSPVDQDLAVVYSPLMPVAFRQLLIEKGYSFIEVPDSEFLSMGCNVLALAPRSCLLVEGNPKTERALTNAHCEVINYPGQQISIAGGGGPTCLTRPSTRLLGQL